MEQVTANYRVSQQERQSGFSFYFSNPLRMSHLKAYTLTLENDVSHFTFKGSQHPKVLL